MRKDLGSEERYSTRRPRQRNRFTKLFPANNLTPKWLQMESSAWKNIHSYTCDLHEAHNFTLLMYSIIFHDHWPNWPSSYSCSASYQSNVNCVPVKELGFRETTLKARESDVVFWYIPWWSDAELVSTSTPSSFRLFCCPAWCHLPSGFQPPGMAE